MRALIQCILIFLFLVFNVNAMEYKPRWSDLPCKICVERPENQGVLNIHETRIVIDDNQAFILSGGQAACAFISPGNHYLYAESYDPYDPNNKNPKAWLSNKITVVLEKGEMAEIEIRRAEDTKESKWDITKVK